MDVQKSYATIGAVFDFLVKMHQKTGRTISFPETLGLMQSEGLLSKTISETPTFHSGMTTDEFEQYLRRLTIYAGTILPQAHTYMQEPDVFEATLFPEGKDVFCYLNMPFMTELPHRHNFFEITFVLKGSCTFLFEGETATLSQGDMCIVAPGSGHSLPLEPGCLALALSVRKSTFDSIFGNLLTQKDLVSLFFRNSLYESRRANYLLLKTGNDPLVVSTVQELTYESNLVDNYSNDCAVSLLNLFLARSLRAANNAVTLYHYEGYSDRDFDFALVLQYIQKNYRTVTLSSLARTFHFSETYLSKLIHKNLSQSFTDVLRTLKMNRAMEYLLNTSMKISEIAEAVGYDSVDHFSRTFRKVYGTPPLEYKKRKQLQKGGQA